MQANQKTVPVRNHEGASDELAKDEQSQDGCDEPVVEKAYMINVASYKHRLVKEGRWTLLEGFSENVLRYIHEIERTNEMR